MKYENGYYKTHPCTDSFTCRNCGRLVVSAGAGSSHRNHCPNCLASLHLDVEPGDRCLLYTSYLAHVLGGVGVVYVVTRAEVAH